jgi:hypothetical protein
VKLSRPAAGGDFPWYDSLWLAKYERARQWLLAHRPQGVSEFERAFDVLRTSPDFQTRHFPSVFEHETMATIRATVASLGPKDLELHEAATFRRFIVHNHPFFTDLQRTLIPLVSEAAGETVEIGYNFLSLYSAQGVCPIHMDSPESKWTLDLCIDQSEPWPIQFSRIQPWPVWRDDEMAGESVPASEMARTMLPFDSFTLEPGEAILFSGSSQWHYRDRMPSGSSASYCQLIFFHFIPAGSADLLKPGNWRGMFDLGDCDLGDAAASR